MEEVNVSVFPNIKAVTGGLTFPLSKIMEAIRTGDPWGPKVLQYRAMPETTEEEVKAKKAFKRSIPYFTGSGVFADRRADDAITQHNNRIIIDFDEVPSVNEAKSLLCADEYSEWVFTSVSGDGVAVVVKIDGDRHLECYKALKAYYKNRFGYVIDKQCSDVSRPRFVSVDVDLHNNPAAKKFIIGRDYVSHVKAVTKKMIEEAPKGEVHHNLIKASRLMGGYIAGKIIDEEEGFEHLVDVMRNKEGVEDLEIEKGKIRDGINNGKLAPVDATQLALTQRSEEERAVYSELYSFANTLNREGRAYTDTDINNLYEKAAVKTEITKAQVEAIFKKVFAENEEEFGINNKPEIIKVEVYLKKNIVFARNVVTGLTEFRYKDDHVWQKLNINTVYRHLQHVGFKFSLDKLSSLFKSDFMPEFNPFVDYFKALPAWDGEDHIGKLADYVKVADQEFFKTQFKKMLVRSIGCSLYGIENRFVFVLVGEKQNTGKSSFIRFLSPWGPKYYTEAPVRNDKDTSFSFAENFIYNMEELASLNNIEVNRLKAIISTATIKERKAYERNAEEHPRRCNFFGSTNKAEFLVDTENTRWLCFNVDDINWQYRPEIDISKVWAQAYALWHSKDFNPQLTREEAAIRDVKNKDYEVSDLEKELIKRVFTVCEPHEGEFMSNADILQALLKHWDGPSGQITGRLIGKHMVQLNFKRDVRKLNGHTVRGYYVLKNNTLEDYKSVHPQVLTQPSDGSAVTSSPEGYVPVTSTKAPFLF